MCWSGWRCLLGSSTAYMLQLSGRLALRISASSQILAFCAATAISQRHPFSVVGFFTYNGLPVEFHLILKNNEIALCRLLKGLERKAWLIRIACLDTIYCLSIFISTCSKSASQLGRHGANINPTAFHPPPTTTPLQF